MQLDLIFRVLNNSGEAWQEDISKLPQKPDSPAQLPTWKCFATSHPIFSFPAGAAAAAHLRWCLPECVLVACQLGSQVLVVSLLALKVCLQDGHSLLIQVLVLVLLQRQSQHSNKR
jgi:hypothetical protein